MIVHSWELCGGWIGHALIIQPNVRGLRRLPALRIWPSPEIAPEINIALFAKGDALGLKQRALEIGVKLVADSPMGVYDPPPWDALRHCIIQTCQRPANSARTAWHWRQCGDAPIGRDLATRNLRHKDVDIGIVAHGLGIWVIIAFKCSICIQDVDRRAAP